MAIRSDIVYDPRYDRFGQLDVHLPESTGPAPVVIIYHGGGLEALRKERMGRVAEFISSCGYVAVNANYRLLPDASFPAPLVDALAAAAWTVEHAEELSGDASRVAALGASAGGYLALMVGLMLGGEHIRGIVDIAGPSTTSYGQTPVAGVDPRLFQPPVELVGPDAPDLLAIHSVADPIVEHTESEAVVERWLASGRPAELFSFAGAGKDHDIWRDDADVPELLESLEIAIARFLGRVLGLSSIRSPAPSEGAEGTGA